MEEHAGGSEDELRHEPLALGDEQIFQSAAAAGGLSGAKVAAGAGEVGGQGAEADDAGSDREATPGLLRCVLKPGSAAAMTVSGGEELEANALKIGADARGAVAAAAASSALVEDDDESVALEPAKKESFARGVAAASMAGAGAASAPALAVQAGGSVGAEPTSYVHQAAAVLDDYNVPAMGGTVELEPNQIAAVGSTGPAPEPTDAAVGLVSTARVVAARGSGLAMAVAPTTAAEGTIAARPEGTQARTLRAWCLRGAWCVRAAAGPVDLVVRIRSVNLDELPPQSQARVDFESRCAFEPCFASLACRIRERQLSGAPC